MHIADAPDWLIASLPQKPAGLPEVHRENLQLNGRAQASGRPGDDFNKSHTWEELLTKYGWVLEHTTGDEAYWTRPGKKEGVSATTNYMGSDVLYPFTTSTELEAQRSYDRFGFYVAMEHGGDFQAGTRALAADGYGDQEPQSVMMIPRHEREVLEAVEAARQYRFDPVFPEQHFVSQWVNYMAERTDAPYELHEAMALSLLGSVAPGIRAGLASNPILSMNTYFLLVGPSSITRKTTTMGQAADILLKAVPGVRLPDEMTPEGLRDVLASRPGRASTWFCDEWSKFYELISGVGYMRGMRSKLLKLYDGGDLVDRRATKRTQDEDGNVRAEVDEIVIHDPHVSVVGTSTEDILEVVNRRDLIDGFLIRFVMIWPETFPPFRPQDVEAPEATQVRQHLVNELQQRLKWAEAHRGPVEWSAGAKQLINEYDEMNRTRNVPILARFGTLGWKIAMISAWGAGLPRGDRLQIGVWDAEYAIALLRRWEPWALRFASEIGGVSPEEERFNGRLDKVTKFIQDNGGRVRRAAIMNKFRLSAKDMLNIRETLIGQARMVPEDEQTSEKSRNMYTEFWRAL